MRRILPLTVAALALSCSSQKLPAGQPPPKTYFTATLADTRFYVADHMLASIEMQISGEPFAQLLGRNLAGYDRFNRTTDLYTDPATGVPVVDPLGYVTGIESYEYSKQPMNNLSFESGAGLSMEFGPLQNPAAVPDNAACDFASPAFVNLLARLQQFSDESHAGGPPMKGFVVSPAPQNNPLNVYGWPGFWPVFAEYRSFDPAIAPAAGATRGCNFVGGYLAAAQGAQVVGDYECGYNSLNLTPRDQHVDKTLDPAAMGFALWKQGLWVINYWQTLHDLAGNPISHIADADLAQVGQPGNLVVGQYPDPNDPTGATMIDGVAGVYLGDITIEGWQGLNMLDEMHNKSQLLLTQLTTTDGTSLGGFSSVQAAIDYDYAAPLRWWPEATAVTETGGQVPPPGVAWKCFPQPTGLQIASPSSKLRGLTALMGGFAELYALTDFANPDVGGQPSSRASFDGDPFPADDGMADGEESPHDRALGVIKVAIVDADRLHFDATNNVMVDEATPSARGTKVTTVDAAYSIVGLRTALRSIASTLTLYSNDSPDTHGVPTALDAVSFAGAPNGSTLADRAVALITAQADFIASHLVSDSGAVANFYDLSTGTADPSPTALESEAAAIRGLLDAYLATSNEHYRDVAIKIYSDLEARFWMEDVRAFRTTAGVDGTLTYTPIVLGSLSGALRQYWKLVANRPGNERVAADLLERFKRTYKLVVNGWDDANADDVVSAPDECTGAGLQMGERALTGELSHPADGADRDHDCVKEISTVGLPSALAGKVVLVRH